MESSIGIPNVQTRTFRSWFLDADKQVQAICRRISYVSAASLVLVMLMAVVDVIGSKFFSKSLRGSTELIAQFNVILVFLAAPYSQVANGFTSIELLQCKFPPVLQTGIRVLGSLLGTVICGFIGIRSVNLLIINFQKGSKTVSGEWGVPLWPFILCLVAGFFLISLAFIWTSIKEVLFGVAWNATCRDPQDMAPTGE